MIFYEIDGSYAGLLTAVFEYFDRKDKDVQICTVDNNQISAFDKKLQIETQPAKAERVKAGLERSLDAEKCRMLYVAFLSEETPVISSIFYIITEVFNKNPAIFINYGDEKVMRFVKAVKSVEREKHRMKAFIRFKKSNDGMFFCSIRPDFNVLPLIATFFKNRYADQPWFIYDEQRKYGLLYDLKQVEEVSLLIKGAQDISTDITTIDIDDEEEKFANLWRDYFKSTNIKSRRNIKLHLQHVPKRYWRYLTEKQM